MKAFKLLVALALASAFLPSCKKEDPIAPGRSTYYTISPGAPGSVRVSIFRDGVVVIPYNDPWPWDGEYTCEGNTGQVMRFIVEPVLTVALIDTLAGFGADYSCEILADGRRLKAFKGFSGDTAQPLHHEFVTVAP